MESSTEKNSWKLVLFSEPTNRETLPIKVFEVAALCLCVAQIGVLLYVTFHVGVFVLLGTVFALIGALFHIMLTCMTIGVLFVALDFFMLTMSIGFIFRKKWTLLGMIVLTLIMSVISYLVLPIIADLLQMPESVRDNFWLAVLVFTLQYLPSIVIGLIMYRWLR